MSSIQQKLADVAHPEENNEQEEEEVPQWAPGEQSAGNECLNCGTHVSKPFARTHGDQDGRVHACIECVPQNKVKWLAAGLRPRVGGALR